LQRRCWQDSAAAVACAGCESTDNCITAPNFAALLLLLLLCCRYPARVWLVSRMMQQRLCWLCLHHQLHHTAKLCCCLLLLLLLRCRSPARVWFVNRMMQQRLCWLYHHHQLPNSAAAAAAAVLQVSCKSLAGQSYDAAAAVLAAAAAEAAWCCPGLLLLADLDLLTPAATGEGPTGAEQVGPNAVDFWSHCCMAVMSCWQIWTY
jgi:hypothetical protein